MVEIEQEAPEANYAMALANGSYSWYKSHAIQSRRLYKTSEIAQLAAAAAIPFVALLAPHNAIAPAALGAALAVLTGSRAVFHWQENYIRFSAAREAVEAERRRYNTGAPPYSAQDARDQILALNVTRIEHEEMATWIKIVSSQDDRRDQREQQE